jgi:hypothetical protein
MLRSEFIIAGCILVLAGIGLCIVGYNKTQPTAAEQAVTFLEGISGEKAPAELRTPKTSGYLFIGGGVLSFLLGIGFILRSRGIHGIHGSHTNRNGGIQDEE